MLSRRGAAAEARHRRRRRRRSTSSTTARTTCSPRRGPTPSASCSRPSSTAIERCEDAGLKRVLGRRSATSTRSSEIERDRAWFQEHGRISSTRAKADHPPRQRLCAELRPARRRPRRRLRHPRRAAGRADRPARRRGEPHRDGRDRRRAARRAHAGRASWVPTRSGSMSSTSTATPARRRPRRQPHPVRPPERPLRAAPRTRTCSPPRSTGSSAGSASAASCSARSPRGGVLKHSHDFNLTRECVLGSRARPRDPRLRRPAGLRHRARDRDPRLQQDRPRPDRVRRGRRLRHHLRRADRGQRGPAPRCCSTSTARSRRPTGSRCSTRLRPGQIVPRIPRNEEPRTGLSMGEHQAISTKRWGIGRAEQDEWTVAQPPQARGRLRRAGSSTT